MSAIPALDRGMAIVELIVRAGRPHRYSEIKRALGGLSDASLNRLLASLVEAGYLGKDAEGRYAPAPRLAAWTEALRHRADFAAAAAEAVRAAAAETRESAAFALLEGERVTIRASENYPNSVTVIGPGQVLHFEADHAAALAILDAVGTQRAAALIVSADSRIADAHELEAGFRLARGDGYFADESRARAGISRLAVAWRCPVAAPTDDNAAPADSPVAGALFLCLPTVRLRGRERALAETLTRLLRFLPC